MQITKSTIRDNKVGIAATVGVIAMFISLAISWWSSNHYAIDPKHPITSAVNYDDIPPATQVPAANDNQVFWSYMQQHKCVRNHVAESVWYDCDNGRWIEDDFLKVVEGNFPYKGGVK
jgi:hypothetical protein